MASDHTNDSPAETKKLDATSAVHTDNTASTRLSQQYMDELFSRSKDDDSVKKAATERAATPFTGELHPFYVENKDASKPLVERTSAAVGAVQPEVKKPDGQAKPGEQAKPDAQHKPEGQKAVKPENHTAPGTQAAKPETHPGTQPAKPETPGAKPETHSGQQPKPETQTKPQTNPGETHPGQQRQPEQGHLPERHPLPSERPGQQIDIGPVPGLEVRPQPRQQDVAPQPGPQGDIPVPMPLPGQPGLVRLGAHDYQVAFGPDGRSESISLTNPDGSALQLTRDAQGVLRVANATGEFQPNNGLIHMEGIPLVVNPDGSIKGDFSFDGKGGAEYKNGNTPDANRFQLKPDGTTVAYDMKNWKKVTFTPDGHSHDQFWDGYEWRQGQMSPDGSRVDFNQEEGKPLFIQRDVSNGQNKTVIGFADQTTFTCDFLRHSFVEQIPGGDGQPPQVINLFYNGASYVEAAQVANDQPRPGDTTVQFKDPQSGDPSSAVLHADGTVTTTRPDNTVVEKDAYGYVSSIAGPKGNWQFRRDVNGDIDQVYHQYPGADGNTVNDVMTRNGFEQNPGMAYWYGYDSLNSPKMPGDAPPFDPNNPAGYDTFVDASGRPVNMNIYVTADGTVRTSQLGSDQQPIVTIQSPGQDSYRDNGTAMISNHAGGVTETIDKTSGEHVYTFNRAGQDYRLSSKDGDCQVTNDGTVIQDHQAQQSREYYMPNGVVANIGSDGGNPPKAVCKEVKVPTQAGQMLDLKNGENGISDLNVLDGGLVSATIAGANGSVQTVLNPASGTKSEKSASENFWRVSATDGSFVGTAVNPDQPVWKVGSNGLTGPGGTSYDTAHWSPAQPSVGPNGELLLVGTGDNTGAQAMLTLAGVAAEKKGTTETFKYPDQTIARYENGQMNAYSINGHDLRLEMAAGANADQGPVTGLTDASGNHLTPLPAGTNYHFDRSSGKFMSEVGTANGVQQVSLWDPGTNTYSIKRAWQTASGQPMVSSVTLDGQNQVLQFAAPGQQAVTVKGNADFKAVNYDLNSGVLSILATNGMQGQYNPDGSNDWAKQGQSAAQASHYNKDGVMVPSAEQGKALQAELAAIDPAAADAAYQNFAADLLGRFMGATSNPTDAVNAFVNDLNQNYLSQMSPPATVQAQIASGSQVTLVIQVGSGATAKTKTIKFQAPTA